MHVVRSFSLRAKVNARKFEFNVDLWDDALHSTARKSTQPPFSMLDKHDVNEFVCEFV